MLESINNNIIVLIPIEQIEISSDSHRKVIDEENLAILMHYS